MYIAAFSFAKYFHEPGIMAVLSFMAYFMHIIYLPIFLLSSLNLEGKTQLWLHNPNSGAKLFLAKLTAGLSFYFISFLIAFLLTFWSVDQAVATGLFVEFEGQVLRTLSIVGIFITSMTIYYCIWILFYWTFFHSMKNMPYVKYIRWPILIFGSMVISMVGNYIRSRPFYEKITGVWTARVHVLDGLNFQIASKEAVMTPSMSRFDFSIINGLFLFLVMSVVFFISVWLLERKVEV